MRAGFKSVAHYLVLNHLKGATEAASAAAAPSAAEGTAAKGSAGAEATGGATASEGSGSETSLEAPRTPSPAAGVWRQVSTPVALQGLGLAL